MSPLARSWPSSCPPPHSRSGTPWRPRRTTPQTTPRRASWRWTACRRAGCVERRHDSGGLLAGVQLEVHEAARKREDVAGGDGPGDELVGGGDEADVERAVEHEDQLGGARVRVRRVEPAGGVVDADEGDAQRVEPRDLLHVGAGDHGAGGAGDGARLGDDVGEKVVRGGVRLARESVHLQLCTRDVSV
jgi:hypothetical protein